MKYTFLFLIVLLALSCESNKTNSTPKETKVEKLEEGDIKYPFVGYVRTTNLSKEDADLLGLKDGAFQLVSRHANYFLEGMEFKNLVGKCVEFEANKTRDAGSEGAIHDYDRSNLTVKSAKVVEAKNCVCEIKPGLSALMKDIKSVHGNKKPNYILTGTIIHSDRPAPDIAYDHYLKLDKPFMDEQDPSGKSKKVDKIWLVPVTHQMIWDMEDLVDRKQKVRVTGYRMGGYAESTIMNAFKIDELN